MLDKKGTTVKATSIEAITEQITATGKLLINSPDASGKNIKGIKAIINVAVQPITAIPICLVAFSVASSRLWPSRIQRSMFSTTTILSSTNKPSDTTRPTILS
ncbi:hypothetical protein D3C73_1482520 [compost metagenome]